MKRLILILFIMLVSVTSAYAQKDTDGDGLPDTRDNCPTQAGPIDNNGCPSLQIVPPDNGNNPPPSNPDPTNPDPVDPPSSQPPANDNPSGDNPPPPASDDAPAAPDFQPPALPNDGCYLTPSGDYRVNVRQLPALDAPIVGQVLPGGIYIADGLVMVEGEPWLPLTDYAGSDGTVGYVARGVVNASICPDVPAWGATFEVGESNGNGTDTVEYCIYQEVQEAGVFQEVCYEIEIPEGCVLTTSEAGVYTVDCGEGETVQLNPALGEMPTFDVKAPTRDDGTVAIGVQLQMVFNQPSSTDGTDTVEYCIYQEVQEAGVFEEVCYEVEIPEGCWLTTAEAGVFTVQCPPELGGEAAFQIEPPQTNAFPNRPSVIDDLIFCQPGNVWWINFQEPDPDWTNGICIDGWDALPNTRPDGSTTALGLMNDPADPQPQVVPIDVWEDLLSSYCYPQDWWSSVDNEGNVSGGCWDSSANTRGDGDTQLGLSIEDPNPEPPIVDVILEQGTRDPAANQTTPEELCPGEIAFFTWLEDDNGDVIPGSADIECVPPDFFD